MSTNRRRDYRYPIDAERELATLKRGKAEISARLLDQSAEGFCVSVTGASDFQIGDDIQLKIYAGHFGAKVVRKVSTESETILGLLRTSDFAVRPSESTPVTTTRYYRPGLRMRGEYVIGIAILTIVPFLPDLITGLASGASHGQGSSIHQTESTQHSHRSRPLSGVMKSISHGFAWMGKQVGMAGDQAITASQQAWKSNLSQYSSSDRSHLRELLSALRTPGIPEAARRVLENTIRTDFPGVGKELDSAADSQGTENAILAELNATP